jgi:hypothetical protein
VNRIALSLQLHKSETDIEVTCVWQKVREDGFTALTGLERQDSNAIVAEEQTGEPSSSTKELVSTKQEPRTS